MNYYKLSSMGIEVAREEFLGDDFSAAKDKIWSRYAQERQDRSTVELKISLIRTECIYDSKWEND